MSVGQGWWRGDAWQVLLCVKTCGIIFQARLCVGVGRGGKEEGGVQGPQGCEFFGCFLVFWAHSN